MRWRLSRLLNLVSDHRSSTWVERQLLMALYAQDNALWMRATIQAVCVLLVFLQSGAHWPFAYGAILVLLTAISSALRHAYWKSRPESHDRRTQIRWLKRITWGEWSYAAVCGASSAVLVLEPDPYVDFLVLVFSFTLVTGVSVRLSAMPIVASGSVLLVMIPIAVAALSTGNSFWMPFSAFALVNILGCRGLTENAHRQIFTALTASERSAELAAELGSTNRKLEELVTTDALTGLVNRRGLDVRLLQECGAARRTGEAFSLLLLDVDHFKSFNDLYGHQRGDDCLRRIATLIRRAAQRPADVVARYGGEEFAIILPRTDLLQARDVAEQLLLTCQTAGIEHRASGTGFVSLSIGVATFSAIDTATPENLLLMADNHLYAAKRFGRNRVMTSLVPAHTDARLERLSSPSSTVPHSPART